MTDESTAYRPIVIDRVERSRGDGDAFRLRLSGRRLMAAAESELDTLLVMQTQGRRHRFAAAKIGDQDPSPGSWQASFTVPDWAVPVEDGQGSLWVGDASIPVPPVGTRIRMPEPSLTPAAEEPAEPKAETDAEAESEAEQAEALPARGEAERAREQEADIVQLRQQLAAANERIAAAVTSDQLRAQEAASLREQLAITGISRDAAIAEAGGLRAELSRLGSELAVARERVGAGDGELGVAQQLLEDARALTAQLRGQGSP